MPRTPKTAKPAATTEAPVAAPKDDKDYAGKKTKCPVTRKQFRELAKQVRVQIGETVTKADPKEFSTGSLGWNTNGKLDLPVGDLMVTVQVGLNLTVVNSKELPKDD